MELFIGIFAALISVINPLGTIPVFISLTKEETKRNRNKTAVWTSVNVAIILLISFSIGNYVLQFFGVSINSLRIAGGLIITAAGFSLLNGSFSKHKGMKRSSVQADLETRAEVSLTPLAIPMLAGPGSISLLIAYNQTTQSLVDFLIGSAAILSSSVVVFFVLKSSQLIVKILGGSGLNAVARIIGFIEIAIGIEYVTSAVYALIKSWNLG
ncbi:MAG: NAAT family transporter [Crocinitomicaceae bacterium]|nr:NAAT family transporter [Crocinitomicaceae bacterium]